ncbi:unannotated protein [freshwater metagenome]|uniref:Unannotated protein n=1 Tax=freshwater metagenome TaxID=449393 RepID=A0A6J6QA13_9ZZZZ
MVHLGWLTVHDHHLSTVTLRLGHHPVHRADGECGPNRNEQIALLGHPKRAVDHLRHEALAKRDRVALQDSVLTTGSAAQAVRVVFARGDAPQCLRHREAVLTVPATGVMHRAVYLDHEVLAHTRELVEPIDVLGDEGMQLCAILQRHDRPMPCVRAGLPGRGVQPRLPRNLPHLGIGEVVGDRCHLFGLRVEGPQPLRAAEVGNTGIG